MAWLRIGWRLGRQRVRPDRVFSFLPRAVMLFLAQDLELLTRRFPLGGIVSSSQEWTMILLSATEGRQRSLARGGYKSGGK